jgi:ABC-type Mn2+/Zn2+ transport system permease subunit
VDRSSFTSRALVHWVLFIGVAVALWLVGERFPVVISVIFSVMFARVLLQLLREERQRGGGSR